MHTPAPPEDHELAGQARQVPEFCGLYVPAGQFRHVVALPKPYVPAAQGWHATETPSIKYVPEPQQTGPPVGLQWP